MAIPRNTDVGNANKFPGIYTQIVNGGGNAVDPNEPSTVVLLGEMLSTGQWAPGGVYTPTSEQDVINGAGGGTAGVAAPTILLQYRAAMAQVGEGNVSVKCVPVLEASGGTAATYPITVHVVNTSTLAATTNPAVAGTLCFQVAGVEVSVGFTTSDTNATIAAALRAELVKQTYLPVTVSAVSTASFLLTFPHKGAYGEDLPLRAYYTPNSGVYIGVGTVTYANQANGAGSTKLTIGTQTCTATITSGDLTSVIAGASSGGLKLALMQDDFPVIGGAVTSGSSSTMPLFMREGRDVRRVAISVVTTTTTTATLSSGSATDGTGSATSFTYNGTQGAGLPVLTTALANLDNAGSFGEWTCPWVTAGGSTTGLTAIATAIEAAGNGENNKNQHLTICSVDSEANAAVIASGTSPQLSTSLRYVVGWCPDAGQMGFELSARRAAMVAAWQTPATNSDIGFGGTPFQSRGAVPLNRPAGRIRPSRSAINTAIIDGLEPWAVLNGRYGVVRGRNTSNATEQELWDPSWIRQQGYQRRDLINDGYATFTSPKVKADGILNQANEISTDSVRGWAVGRMQVWEKAGVYDGAEQLKGAVKCEVDSQFRDRINLFVPSSPVVMAHQFLVVLGRSVPTI